MLIQWINKKRMRNISSFIYESGMAWSADQIDFVTKYLSGLQTRIVFAFYESSGR